MLWKLLLVISLCTHVKTNYHDSDVSLCCSQTTSTECMNTCKMMSDLRKYSAISKRLPSFLKSCPLSETQFWICLKSSQFMIDFRKKVEQKYFYKTRLHTSCCKDAIHSACELQCLTTKNVSLLKNENCDAVREPKFAACINKAHASQQCCKDTEDVECRIACQQYFKKSMTSSVDEHRSNLEEKCGTNSKQMQCAMNNSDYRGVVTDFTTCCSEHTAPKCARTCKEYAHKKGVKQLIGLLIPVCGPFKHTLPVYQCILETAISISARKPVNPVRSVNVPARKHYVSRERTVSTTFKHPCCARAKSQNCRKWCMETISKTFQSGLWDSNYLACIQNTEEAELSSCMTSMMEPCKMGGKRDELQFCSNLNNRPLELFRRFNSFGDSSAQKLIKFWNNGPVKVLQYEFQFKDLTTCYLEKFKALACLLAVEPCSHNSPMIQVCRTDCEDLLSKCLESSKTSSETTPKNICSLLLPNTNQTKCLKLDDYVKKPIEVIDDKVTLPCENNPCGHGEVCIINQSYDRLQLSSKPYQCIHACPVDGKSNLVIPVRQFAKLVVSERLQECYQVCECQIRLSDGQSFTVFDDCKQFGCHKKRNCTVGKKEYRDGEVFIQDCNTCTCYDGKLICGKKNCAGNQQRSVDLNLNIERSRRNYKKELKIRSPCDCSSLYSPVCGVNGMTFPNSCLAKCWLLDDNQLEVGDCQAVDPCNPNPCPISEPQCMPKRRVCLTTTTHCPQYTCQLPDPGGYYKQPNVCDRFKSSPVCGYDAVTYDNKCLAKQAGTGVDYEGPCLHVHFDKPEANVDRCEKITCRPVKQSNCEFFIPQGSCCPVCGSVLRVLYNERDLINHHNYINNKIPITIPDVVGAMRQLQEVAECKLYGHLTVEGDIMFLILVNTEYPTKAQVYACNNEAKKLQMYINKRSPMVGTPYYLSILKVSTLQTTNWNVNKPSSANYINNNKTSLNLILLLSLFLSFLIFLIR